MSYEVTAYQILLSQAISFCCPDLRLFLAPFRKHESNQLLRSLVHVDCVAKTHGSISRALCADTASDKK